MDQIIWPNIRETTIEFSPAGVREVSTRKTRDELVLRLRRAGKSVSPCIGRISGESIEMAFRPATIDSQVPRNPFGTWTAPITGLDKQYRSRVCVAQSLLLETVLQSIPNACEIPQSLANTPAGELPRVALHSRIRRLYLILAELAPLRGRSAAYDATYRRALAGLREHQKLEARRIRDQFVQSVPLNVEKAENVLRETDDYLRRLRDA